MKQNKEQVVQIIKKSNNVEELRKSINNTTDNKYPEQVQQFAISLVKFDEVYKKASLRDAEIEGVVLSNVNLENVNLTEADLTDIDLSKYKLADFSFPDQKTTAIRLSDKKPPDRADIYNLAPDRADIYDLVKEFYLWALTADNQTVTDDKIVTTNEDDDGKYIEIDYSNLKPDTNYLVNYDNQKYGVKKITDEKFEIYEVLEDG